MTWTRKELKELAKEALQRNYWKIILVSFLSLLFCHGFFGAASSGNRTANVTADRTAASVTVEISDTAQDSDASDVPAYTSNAGLAVGITIFILIAVFILVILYTLQVLLIFPLHVGINRFMLKSIDDTAQVKEIAYGFDHSYRNVIKTMFHYDIRIFLWTLLFIIPGFYKQYQYRMVPYILAEHPDMNYREVLRKSTDMMDGHKWKAFVLDLSFLLWHIAGLMTCGILELFYVIPYQDLTCAALYRTLSRATAQPPEPPALPDAGSNEVNYEL